MTNVPIYHFALNMKKLRECRGMTVPQVCIILGISAITYEPWETSATLPNSPMLVRICNLFGYFDLYRMMTKHIDFKKELIKAETI